MSWIKIALVNIIVVFFILFLVELGASALYFHKNASTIHSSSLLWLINGIAKKIDRAKALTDIERMSRSKFDADLVLINPKSDVAKQFGKYLTDEYEKEFAKLVTNLKNNNIPLLILWLPTNKSEETNRFYNQYFENLSVKYSVSFLSGMALLDEPREHIFLEPYDGHLTRYANILIADQLYLKLKTETIDKNKSLKCSDIQGIWKPNVKEVWPIIPEVPYLLTTDEFGFRSSLPYVEKDINNPTILIAGDSFTFGPYLSSYDTYPARLNRQLEQLNVVNGGVSSFSIRSERALIERNIKCLNPSLVILQVLDNDISGMAIAKYNEYNFKGETFDLPPVERLFYDSLH